MALIIRWGKRTLGKHTHTEREREREREREKKKKRERESFKYWFILKSDKKVMVPIYQFFQTN
jgi:hypothetical protein